MIKPWLNPQANKPNQNKKQGEDQSDESMNQHIHLFFSFLADCFISSKVNTGYFYLLCTLCLFLNCYTPVGSYIKYHSREEKEINNMLEQSEVKSNRQGEQGLFRGNKQIFCNNISDQHTFSLFFNSSDAMSLVSWKEKKVRKK